MWLGSLETDSANYLSNHFVSIVRLLKDWTNVATCGHYAFSGFGSPMWGKVVLSPAVFRDFAIDFSSRNNYALFGNNVNLIDDYY